MSRPTSEPHNNAGRKYDTSVMYLTELDDNRLTNEAVTQRHGVSTGRKCGQLATVENRVNW